MVRWIGWSLCISFIFPLLGRDFFKKDKSPEWSILDSFQGKVSRDNFEYLLKTVYCPRESWRKDWIVLKQDEVLIRKTTEKNDWYSLRYMDENRSSELLAEEGNEKFWASLKGKKIVLDPGHIGGEYSEMEGRHFSIEGAQPVKEGDLSLDVSRVLREKLEGVGVNVILLREDSKPVTNFMPSDFIEEAQRWVFQKEEFRKQIFPEEERTELIKKRSEVLFYRTSEIYARAEVLNKKIKPDLAICVHLNAAPWSDPDNHILVDRNDYHVLVNGCYMGGELADPFQRYEMVFRLLQGWHPTELKIADNISRSFGSSTNMPAFSYKGPNALKVGDVNGVWARNLLANRIYQCPVVFLEPYVANSKETYERIQLGNYQGRKMIYGDLKLSLVEEYADIVFRGLLASFDQVEK